MARDRSQRETLRTPGAVVGGTSVCVALGADHPDDRAPNNHPKLLVYNGSTLASFESTSLALWPCFAVWPFALISSAGGVQLCRLAGRNHWGCWAKFSFHDQGTGAWVGWLTSACVMTAAGAILSRRGWQRIK
jgi:hypothetical protein